MKTAVISDIHVDINEEYPVVEALAEELNKRDVQLLLLAGDISDCADRSIQTVERLEQESGVRVLYVPGNHDMWDKEKKYGNNDRIYEKYLADGHCLSGKCFETDRYFVVGDIGWYDYSYGNPGYTREEFELMSRDGRIFQDFLFNTWTENNQGRCAWFVENLREKIRKAGGKKVVLMTHMLSHEAFLVPENIGNWAYFNAFLGSRALERLCREEQVAYAICGHVHYRKNIREGNTTWLCRCLNYHTEWQENQDIRKQIADAMEVIEL